MNERLEQWAKYWKAKDPTLEGEKLKSACVSSYLVEYHSMKMYDFFVSHPDFFQGADYSKTFSWATKEWMEQQGWIGGNPCTYDILYWRGVFSGVRGPDGKPIFAQENLAKIGDGNKYAAQYTREPEVAKPPSSTEAATQPAVATGFTETEHESAGGAWSWTTSTYDDAKQAAEGIIDIYVDQTLSGRAESPTEVRQLPYSDKEILTEATKIVLGESEYSQAIIDEALRRGLPLDSFLGKFGWTTQSAFEKSANDYYSRLLNPMRTLSLMGKLPAVTGSYLPQINILGTGAFLGFRFYGEWVLALVAAALLYLSAKGRR